MRFQWELGEVRHGILSGKEQGKGYGFGRSILRFNRDYLLRFIMSGHDYGIHDGASLVILSIFNEFQFTFYLLMAKNPRSRGYLLNIRSELIFNERVSARFRQQP